MQRGTASPLKTFYMLHSTKNLKKIQTNSGSPNLGSEQQTLCLLIFKRNHTCHDAFFVHNTREEINLNIVH